MAMSQVSSEMRRTSPSSNISQILLSYGVILAFIALFAALSVASPYFLTWVNLTNVIRQTAINGVLAVGLTFVILAGGIDLSVGSMMALSGAVGASLSVLHSAVPVPVALAAALATGCVAGSINGFLIAYFRVPAFVMTLGMLSAARGLVLIYTNGRPISNLQPSFLWLGSGYVAGVSVPIITLALVFASSAVVLRYTVFGRHVLAVGGSEKAAKTSGIKTGRVILLTYMISGLLSGLAGLILTARTTAALPQGGVGYELDAIAAVVIGGTSLSGGRGTLVGTLFGALIIGVINNGLDLLGVSSYYQQVVKGLIIVGAVMLDRNRSR